jgi:hypothetical protein
MCETRSCEVYYRVNPKVLISIARCSEVLAETIDHELPSTTTTRASRGAIIGLIPHERRHIPGAAVTTVWVEHRPITWLNQASFEVAVPGTRIRVAVGDKCLRATPLLPLALASRLHRMSRAHPGSHLTLTLDSTQCRHADPCYPSAVNVDQIPLVTICHAMSARG